MQDLGQEFRRHVAAGQEHDGGRTVGVGGDHARPQGGHADRTGALEHQPHLVGREGHGGTDVGLAHRAHLDVMVQRDAQRHRARLEVPGQAVGHGRLDVDRDDGPGGQRGAHGRRRLRLDADDPDARALEAQDHPGQQAAAAARDHDGAQPGHLVEQLAGQGGLAGDDVGVVVGRHVAAALGRGQLQRVGLGLAVALAVEDEADVELAQGRDLGGRGSGGHDHGHLRPQLGGGVGQSQPVIAGRRGDHGPTGLVLERGRDGGQPAPHLERAGGLHRLDLDRHGRSELGRLHDRRRGKEPPDRLPRCFEVGGTGDRHVAHGSSLAAPGLAC